jgi:two-component system sensor histidine kinase KdpD
VLSRPPVRFAVGMLGVAAATLLLRLTHVGNATTIALGYMLVTLFVAAMGDIVVAITVSIAAAVCFNFFFLPPVGTFTIADAQNWVALGAFLIVSVVASRLSATARARAREALERRNELTRLFDLTRDILLTTEYSGALAAIARHVARRFELETAAICVPSADNWQVHHGGTAAPAIADADLDAVFAANAGRLEFDARTRAYGGHREVASTGGTVTLAPVRLGGRVIALLATGGRLMEPGTRDAVAGIVAIALERLRFMEERRGAELTQQRAELASALLAALSHDLRTPLTAIRTAVTNLDTDTLREDQRREQARVAADELQRLTRLFDEILDMARIDSGTLRPHRRWTTPAEIVEAAVAHEGATLAGHDIRIDADEARAVEVDPRLVSSALAHLLENAVRYAGTAAIAVQGWTDEHGLRLDVRDQGPGLKEDELQRLFEPFYRGQVFRNQTPGTGMGLAITRGLVAADGGRVWAENLAPRGACFSIAVPGATRATTEADV